MRVRLLQGDCVARMDGLPESSLGAVICDPPYGLRFMGKAFDDLGDGALQRLWHRAWFEGAYKVLKPGGIIKAFGGTRTFHHLAAAMEDAGFEDIRLEAWGYGSGFPKSLNVGKSLDKQVGVSLDTQKAIQVYLRECREALGLSRAAVDRAVFAGSTRYGWVEGRGGARSNEVYLPTPEEWIDLKAALQLDDRFDAYIKAAIPSRADRYRSDGGKANQVGTVAGDWGYQHDGERWDGERRITAPASEAAALWDGWGTALKPAWEPVVIGTKPLGTIPPPLPGAP
jgi:hypothetical protein